MAASRADSSCTALELVDLTFKGRVFVRVLYSVGFTNLKHIGFRRGRFVVCLLFCGVTFLCSGFPGIFQDLGF